MRKYTLSLFCNMRGKLFALHRNGNFCHSIIHRTSTRTKMISSPRIKLLRQNFVEWLSLCANLYVTYMLNWIEIKSPHFTRCYKLSDWTPFSLPNVNQSGDSIKSGQLVIFLIQICGPRWNTLFYTRIMATSFLP